MSRSQPKDCWVRRVFPASQAKCGRLEVAVRTPLGATYYYSTVRLLYRFSYFFTARLLDTLAVALAEV